jgi:DNA adenine methylase
VKKLQTVLKYPGSKWSTAQWIISNFPAGYEKMTYLETFAGSLAVFFNKNRSVIETINDLDGNVVNLFRVIREHPEELARLIEFTPWSREEYKNSYILTGNSLEDARRFLVRMWQAIGAKSSDITGWRNNIKGNNGNLTQFNMRLPRNIIEASLRLKHTSGCLVQIENQPAVKLIQRHNQKNVLIYADPPYVRSTRSGRIYKCEMTDQDHVELLETLLQHSGPVIISGYESELYNGLLSGWNVVKQLARCEGGQERTEILWMNYETHAEQLQIC